MRSVSRVVSGLVIGASLAAVGVSGGCAGDSTTTVMRDSVRASSSIADVRSQLSRARASVVEVQGALGAFTEAGVDTRAAFDALGTRIAQLSTEAERSRARWRDMRSRADAYMSGWQSELSSMSSGELRQLSEDQLASMRADFNELVSRGRALSESFDPFLTRLNDLRTALGTNLSPATIQRLQPQLVTSREAGDEVLIRLDALTRTLESFTETWKPAAR